MSPANSSVAGLGDAGLSAIGYVSPPSGMSGGAAAGVGLGLMLLGGLSDPVRATQVVAWVPSDQAGSPEEVSALVLQKVEEDRRKSFSGGLSKLGMQTVRYPDGHSRSYATPADIFAERPIPFADTPAASPSFLASPRSYGPIFIRHNQFTLDAYKNDMTTSEAMLKASKYLPEWIYIYHAVTGIGGSQSLDGVVTFTGVHSQARHLPTQADRLPCLSDESHVLPDYCVPQDLSKRPCSRPRRVSAHRRDTSVRALLPRT